jgi:hypothetical protein
MTDESRMVCLSKKMIGVLNVDTKSWEVVSNDYKVEGSTLNPVTK